MDARKLWRMAGYKFNGGVNILEQRDYLKSYRESSNWPSLMCNSVCFVHETFLMYTSFYLYYQKKSFTHWLFVYRSSVNISFDSKVEYYIIASYYSLIIVHKRSKPLWISF